jgi:hypothetical protein
MRILVSFFVLVLASAVAGCGDDNGGTAVDAGPSDSGPAVLDAGPRPDAPARTDAGGGDGNESCDEAVAVALNAMDGEPGVINPAGDHDFFSFAGTAGSWVVISTDANPDDELDRVDTVLRLYDSSMTMVAENDDGVPRVNTDSEIIIRLPADDTYCVEVLEFTEWADTPPYEGQPDYTYTVAVTELDPASPVLVEDPETGDDAASATPLEFDTGQVAFTIGTFRDETDVDVFSFTVAAGMNNVQTNIMPAGPTGYGSTTSAGNLWVTDAAGTTIIARIDNTTTDWNEIGPNLLPGDYLLWVEHPGGTAGANDFYVLKTFRAMDNPPIELDDTGNDTLAGAEVLPMTADGDLVTGFLLTHLGSPTDVDYFSFDVADGDIGTGEVAGVVCGSMSSGSGVMGLSVEVRNAADMVLSSATESVPDAALIEDARLPAPSGTFYVRIAKTGQDAEVTGDWVRCAVRLGLMRAP